MFAAIDIGSNTVQLMIAETDNEKILRSWSWLKTTRLGSGTEQWLHAEPIAHTAAAVQEFMQIIAEHGVTQTRIVATSAVRDAKNSEELLTAIATAAPTAPQVEILRGKEEARISYTGACAALSLTESVPVIDLGGSSAELIYPEKKELRYLSGNIGAVRAHQNHWSRQEIYRRVQDFYPVLPHLSQVIGVGGTITTVAGVLRKLTSFQRQEIEGVSLSRADLEGLVESLEPLSISERCQYSPLLECRGEIIVEGLYIWLALLDHIGFTEVLVTGGGILDGTIIEMLRNHQEV